MNNQVKEIISFMRLNANNRTNEELRQLVNKTFNVNYNLYRIKYLKKHYKIKCNGREVKIKNQTKPEFSEMKCRNQVYIKVDGKWVSKRKYVYEKINGKLPKNYKVYSLDRSTDNYSKDNLLAYKEAEGLSAQNKNILGKDKDGNKLAFMIVRIENEVKNKANKKHFNQVI